MPMVVQWSDEKPKTAAEKAEVAPEEEVVASLEEQAGENISAPETEAEQETGEGKAVPEEKSTVGTTALKSAVKKHRRKANP